jgi:hypothetical protein
MVRRSTAKLKHLILRHITHTMSLVLPCCLQGECFEQVQDRSGWRGWQRYLRHTGERRATQDRRECRQH